MEVAARPEVTALLEQTSHARAFAPGPLPPMALRRIVEAGRLAPSLFNTQPWRFAVVRGAAYERLRRSCDRGRDTFFKMLPVFEKLDRKMRDAGYRRGLERQRSGAVLPEFGTAIVILRDPAVPESAEACACAALAMALAATGEGVASAFTSWTRSIPFDKAFAAELAIPKGWTVASSLVVGNPVAPLVRTRKERHAFDDVVAWHE